MMDPKVPPSASNSLVVPSAIRGDLGAFASTSSSTGPSIAGAIAGSLQGSQQLNLGQDQRFDEDSNIRLIKVTHMRLSFKCSKL